MNKNINRIFGSLLTLLLSGCSKTTVHMNCIPPLYYELDKTSDIFILGETRKESLSKALKKHGLMTIKGSVNIFGGQMGTPRYTVEKDARQLQLLGPVFFYQSSPFNSFDSSGTYVYIEYNSKQLWVSLLGLRFLGLYIPTDNNVSTSKKLGIPTTITKGSYFNSSNWKCPSTSEANKS